MKAATRGLCLAIALTVSGCAGEQYGQKETGGAVGGAVLGGFAGSLIGGGTGQLVSAGIGTLIGALLGSQAGRSLDRSDQLFHRQAAEQAHWGKIGETARWRNDSTCNTGSVTATRQRTTTATAVTDASTSRPSLPAAAAKPRTAPHACTRTVLGGSRTLPWIGAVHRRLRA